MTTLKKISADATDTNKEQSPYMNEDEKEVLDADGEQYIEDVTKVSSKKMNSVIELLQDEFNLKGKHFELIGYSDKGNKVVATLANSEYEAQFVIKSSDILMHLELKK